MSSPSPQQAALPPNYNGGPGILAEYYILTITALALVLLRTWVRTRLTNNWGWDDTTMAFAMVLLIVNGVLITIEVSLGLGQHIEYLANPKQQALDILKFNTFFQMMNVLCTLFTKISISMYILRIRNNRTVRWVLWVLMTFMTLATLAVIVVLSVSCIPLEALWDPAVPGKCLPLNTVYNVAYVQSAFTIVVDLCLTVSPIIILWNVKIKNGRKTFICFLMSLGLVSTISNALRNAFQGALTAEDFTYATIPVSVVAILELTSGIIAACVPACMPAFQRKNQASQKSAYAYNYSVNSRSAFTNRSTVKAERLESSTQSGMDDSQSLESLHTKGAAIGMVV